MCALFRDDLDPSKKAGAVLEYILEDSSPSTEAVRTVSATVADELKETSVVMSSAQREKSRVLFLTRDSTMLEEGSSLRAHMRTVAPSFDEVHIVVLATIYEAKKATLRDGTNMWIYTTGAKNALDHFFATPRLIREQLVFADGFRADVVVALEPFVAGLVGLHIAATYGRAFQQHVREDFLSEQFDATHRHAFILEKVAWYVLGRSPSVCVSTQTLQEQIQKGLRRRSAVRVLPHFTNMQVRTPAQGETSDELFPQFSFVILFAGMFDADNTFFRAIDAARSVLFSQKIGFVAVGDGPMKKACEERTKLLGVFSQVVFEKNIDRFAAILPHADIFLCTDTDQASDDRVVMAAAAEVPLILVENQFRRALFTDGEDAFLCPKDDTVCISKKLTQFLNTTGLRTQFRANAKDIVTARITSDPERFRLAYRSTIESAFDPMELSA